MIDRKATLTTTQLEVLTWVSHGCSQGVYEGWSHRLVARALHNRGLITVKGHGPSWSASITDEGIYYLEHRSYPPRDSERPVAAATTDSSPRAPTRTVTTSSRKPPTQKRGATDRLMQSLKETAGNRILVRHGEAPRYRGLANSAKRLGRIPEGMRLSFEHVRLDTGDHVAITLTPLPEWLTAVLTPLPVSKALSDATDVVQTLVSSETFPVSGEQRDRAFLLLDALVRGARQFGVAVSIQAERAAHRRLSARTSHEGEVLFKIDEDAFGLRFTQATLKRPHQPTERELARARQGYLFPDFDEVPDDHLGLVLEGGGGRFWADSWKDTDDHRLEDDLAQILEEMRLQHGHLASQRAAEIEYRRQAQRDRAERETQLAAARERAKVAYREYLIDKAARSQARRWTEAGQLRAYAAEVRRHASSLAPQDRPEALSWADRIATVADVTDPLPDQAVRPSIFAEPTPSDLQAFLKP
ncbi:hypothetical protein [Amycolatopsis sp. cmx-4-54]|uniref:hypothetical protein n=1 Tax=Amycolatopsis sp. cmx-4-54 TaxID=2790936 RepID=UPI00397E6CCC